MQEYFMKRAIELAMLGSGFTNPDPLASAVLVKEGRIIAEAYYQSRYADYPEQQVMIEASGQTEDAELYLPIEPFCSDEEALQMIRLFREKKIKKVYIGMADPNPAKMIDFAKELRDAGIVAETELLKEACSELNEIYAYYIVHKMPFVIVKWAMTLDGKLATRTGDSKWISSEDSLIFVHHLRQRVMAILVGENTVKMDDPLLTTRLNGVPLSNPLRVIISRLGDLPMDAKVLQVSEEVKTMVIASEQLPSDKEKILLQKGVQVAMLREVNHHIDFRDVVKLLGDMGIDSLYIEGGSAILGSAFESGIVHKVYAAVAPKIIGGRQAFTPVGGNGIERMGDAIVLQRVSHEIIGHDVIVKGYIN
jgi:diaminohydroxyphosphoribosylaminopyrimidine deaminase/5-amino-6-(5-phosphoribosylamino)uracil reductase